MIRVAAYIDGFNLYFGLKAKYGRKYLWLNLQALSASLLRPDQALEKVTYFTARVRGDSAGEQRQFHYLEALARHCPLVKVIAGRFQEKICWCRNCKSSWTSYEEKETDVNLAVALVEDAVQDRYDTALVISADSDLCPGFRSVKRLAPEKQIIAAFPPKRRSGDLQRTADGCFTISDNKIRQAQLPSTVTTAREMIVHRPEHWS